jgi:hypothetical protein
MVSSVGTSATIAAASRALPLLVSSDLASFSKPSPFLEISSFERVSQFLDLTLTAGTSLILFCGTTFSAKFQTEKKKKKNLQKSLVLWQGGNLLKLHKTLSKKTIGAAIRRVGGGGGKKVKK